MNTNIYKKYLEIIENAGSEADQVKYDLYCKMMHDISCLSAEDFTDDHIMLTKQAQLYFADLDEYDKASELKRVVDLVDKVRETKKKIEEELEKLRKLKEDYGKEDDQ